MSKKHNVDDNSEIKKINEKSFKKAIKIVVFYFLFSCCWIVISDLIAVNLYDNDNSLSINLVKGLLFVSVSALLMYLLIKSSLKKLIAVQHSLQNLNDKLYNTNIELNKEKQKLVMTDVKLKESERSKSVLLSNLPGMAYRCNYDADWTMQFVSQGCYDLTGYDSESLLYNNKLSFNQVIAPKYRDELSRQWELIIDEKRPFKQEYEIITATGERKWVLEMGQVIYKSDGSVEALEGIIIDITDRKTKELQIKYINEHDFITGLYNGRFFEEFLVRQINSKSMERSAVITVHVKKLSVVTLTHGHRYAENLLIQISTELSRYCSNDCTLFQITMEHFAFFIKNYNKTKLKSFCDELLDTLKAELIMDTVSANIGVYEIDYNSQISAEKIMKNAIIASEINNNENFSCNYYDEKIENKLLREAKIKKELTTIAIEENIDSLYLLFQPIFHLKSNAVRGFEALARLKSKELGNISPNEFIPIAEETQLIVPIGKKIMYLAFDFLKQLENNGFGHAMLSLNISAIQLLRDDFHTDLIDAINEMKINPANLIIEITETVFSDNLYEVNEKLKKIKDLGIKIAIDDFGTGYSSLARERELNVDILKIDKSFIDKLMEIDHNLAITSDIISMAHKIGHNVVAEGVEHEKQKQYLIDNNCDCIQGYLFSKPVNLERALEIIKG